MKRFACYWLLAAALPSVNMLRAQSLPTAPVPMPLQGEHRVFIGNAEGPGLGRLRQQVLYADLFNGLSEEGSYHPVLEPSQADLWFTLAEVAVPNVLTNYDLYVRVEIVDSKTHALLWAVYQFIGAFREKTLEKDALVITKNIIADLQTLSHGQIPSDAAAAKYDNARRSGK